MLVCGLQLVHPQSLVSPQQPVKGNTDGGCCPSASHLVHYTVYTLYLPLTLYTIQCTPCTCLPPCTCRTPCMARISSSAAASTDCCSWLPPSMGSSLPPSMGSPASASRQMNFHRPRLSNLKLLPIIHIEQRHKSFQSAN